MRYRIASVSGDGVPDEEGAGVSRLETLQTGNLDIRSSSALLTSINVLEDFDYSDAFNVSIQFNSITFYGKFERICCCLPGQILNPFRSSLTFFNLVPRATNPTNLTTRS